MRLLKLSLLSLGLVAGATTSAAAQQVTFDDLTNHYLHPIVSEYAGLTWTNAYVMNVPVVYPTLAGGFGTVLSSGDRVLLNGGGGAMSISGSTFNLLGGTFAAGWTKGLNLNVKGYAGGSLLYDQDYTLDWTAASQLGLNLYGVDNVVFTSSGGTVDVDTFGNGPNQSFGADNLEFGEYNSQRIFFDGDINQAVVPEPMTVSLMAAGLLVLGGAQARRRRANKQ